jgi:hypothetical protein
MAGAATSVTTVKIEIKNRRESINYHHRQMFFLSGLILDNRREVYVRRMGMPRNKLEQDTMKTIMACLKGWCGEVGRALVESRFDASGLEPG